MLSATPPPSDIRACEDCRLVPADDHLNSVSPLRINKIYDTIALGPHMRELYGRDWVCDPCFLRRRLEGKL